jgi:cytoskeletal protein CcmA (bactofilin family)
MSSVPLIQSVRVIASTISTDTIQTNGNVSIRNLDASEATFNRINVENATFNNINVLNNATVTICGDYLRGITNVDTLNVEHNTLVRGNLTVLGTVSGLTITLDNDISINSATISNGIITFASFEDLSVNRLVINDASFQSLQGNSMILNGNMTISGNLSVSGIVTGIPGIDIFEQFQDVSVNSINASNADISFLSAITLRTISISSETISANQITTLDISTTNLSVLGNLIVYGTVSGIPGVGITDVSSSSVSTQTARIEDLTVYGTISGNHIQSTDISVTNHLFIEGTATLGTLSAESISAGHISTTTISAFTVVIQDRLIAENISADTITGSNLSMDAENLYTTNLNTENLRVTESFTVDGSANFRDVSFNTIHGISGFFTTIIVNGTLSGGNMIANDLSVNTNIETQTLSAGIITTTEIGGTFLRAEEAIIGSANFSSLNISNLIVPGQVQAQDAVFNSADLRGITFLLGNLDIAGDLSLGGVIIGYPSVDTSQLTISSITAIDASINVIDASYATIEILDAGTINVTTLQINTNSSLGTLTATSFTASNGDISDLSLNILTVSNSLRVNGEISAGTVYAGTLKADRLNVRIFDSSNGNIVFQNGGTFRFPPNAVLEFTNGGTIENIVTTGICNELSNTDLMTTGLLNAQNISANIIDATVVQQTQVLRTNTIEAQSSNIHVITQIFRIAGNMRTDGNIYIAGNLVVYGTIGSFTGAHLVPFDEIYYTSVGGILPDTDIGRVVSSTGKIQSVEINNALPYVIFTSIPRDPCVYGIFSGFSKEGMNQDFKVNSVGEGGIWITSENGSLRNGDLLCTGTCPGYATKQTSPENIFTNYTIGKVLMDCDFTLPEENIPNGIRIRYLRKDGTIISKEEYHINPLENYKVYFAGCTYHCG